MKQRDWFEVGLRLIGVWQITVAMDEFVTVGDVLMKYFRPSVTTLNGYLTHSLAHLLIGLFLLLYAARVTTAFYGQRPADEAS